MNDHGDAKIGSFRTGKQSVKRGDFFYYSYLLTSVNGMGTGERVTTFYNNPDNVIFNITVLSPSRDPTSEKILGILFIEPNPTCDPNIGMCLSEFPKNSAEGGNTFSAVPLRLMRSCLSFKRDPGL